MISRWLSERRQQFVGVWLRHRRVTRSLGGVLKDELPEDTEWPIKTVYGAGRRRYLGMIGSLPLRRGSNLRSEVISHAAHCAPHASGASVV